MRKIAWHVEAWDEFIEWQETDRKTAAKISKLVRLCSRDPFGGDGQPEPLKHDFAGFWSRRINAKDRLVYRVNEDAIEIIQCRMHYRDH